MSDSDEGPGGKEGSRRSREYKVGAWAESIAYYGPGLFHPVYIGEVYKEGRYKIEQKFGWGASATVWGARDLQTGRFVAVKVVAANESQDSKELRILQRLRDSNLDHPGRRHVAEFLDHFYHDGVNGRHLCLVTEALGQTIYQEIDHTTFSPADGSTCRPFARQILLAIDFLHKCHVVHGDLHNTNIMVPFLDCESYGEPWIGKVTRHDGGPIEKGIPEYLVGKPTIKTDLEKLMEIGYRLHFKIVDFSSSFFDDEHPIRIRGGNDLSPPETIFRKPLTKASDIWQLACITFWAATAQDLFCTSADSRTLIPQIYTTIGKSSANWLLVSLMEGVRDKIWAAGPGPIGIGKSKGLNLEGLIQGIIYHPDKTRDNAWKQTEASLKRMKDRVHTELERKAEEELVRKTEEELVSKTEEELVRKTEEELEKKKEEELIRKMEEKLEKEKKKASLYVPMRGNPEVERYITDFARYLRRLLVADPEQRPTAEELLTDDFVHERYHEDDRLYADCSSTRSLSPSRRLESNSG